MTSLNGIYSTDGQAKMSRMNYEQLEWALEERLKEVRETLDLWRQRVKSPDQVTLGSSLAVDDQVYPPLPCSQLAWWGLAVGVEHLDAAVDMLDRQVAQGQSIMPLAAYTVLRGGLIGASQAVLLLCTPQRDKRVNYGLQIAHEEYRQVYNFRKATVEHPTVSEEDRQAVLSEDYLGWSESGKKRVKALLNERNETQMKLNDTDLITEAARVMQRDTAEADFLSLGMGMEWRLGSGAAHGRLLMNMHRQRGYRQDQEGQIAYFGGAKKEVMQQIALVRIVLSKAWRMWDLRRTPYK